MFTKMGNGFLMRSDFYEEGGNKPEFYGRITIGGEGDENPFVGELGAWVKTNEAGKKYFSIAVTVKDVENTSEPASEPALEPEKEDDVPF